MSDPEQSSRRRHILSSINPDPPQKIRHRSRSPSPRHRDAPKRETEDETVTSQTNTKTQKTRDEATAKNEDGEEDRTRPRRTRLKLKDEKRRRRRSRSRSRSRTRTRRHHDDQETESTHDRHRRHHRRRRHRSRRDRSPTPPNPYEAPPLDPDAAFRESLFDAMADEEGADYWESVYGQPIHIYSNERSSGQDGSPDGPLERMTDEEYAAHVRQKMWEKTHAGLLEERARREEVRKAKEQENRRARRLQAHVEESLRRGEERRSRRRWAQRWSEYQTAWEAEGGSNLPWPVESGRREDISEANIRDFFIHGLDCEDEAKKPDSSAKSFVASLKDERVRWHPDKIQQRLGGQVDEIIMRDVTAIFQIIDKLWSDTRSKN